MLFVSNSVQHLCIPSLNQIVDRRSYSVSGTDLVVYKFTSLYSLVGGLGGDVERLRKRYTR